MNPANIATEWDDVRALEARREALRQANEGLQREIADLEALKAGYNPLRGLAHVFKRAVRIPRLEKSIRANTADSDALGHVVLQRARTLADMLIAKDERVVAEARARSLDFETKRRAHDDDAQRYRQALNIAGGVAGHIDASIAQCGHAITANNLASFDGENPGVALMAQNTRDAAVTSLRNTQAQLSSFAAFMNQGFGATVWFNDLDNHIDGLTAANGLMFWADLTGYGGFFDWQNSNTFRTAAKDLATCGKLSTRSGGR